MVVPPPKTPYMRIVLGIREAPVTTQQSPEIMGALTREIFMAAVDRMDHQLDGTELILSQWLALKLISAGSIRCVGDVGREIGLETGASTRLVDQLENRGFIVRSRSVTDRRVVGIRLTDDGAAVIESMQPRLACFWRERLRMFSGEEIDLLFNMLFRLRDGLRSDEANSPSS